MFFSVPAPQNEPVFTYQPGSTQRQQLQDALQELYGKHFEIPAIIGGEEVFTGSTITAFALMIINTSWQLTTKQKKKKSCVRLTRQLKPAKIGKKCPSITVPLFF